MKARDVVGKRIVAIEQKRMNTQQQGCLMVTALQAIILEDGTRLTFVTHETDFGEYWVEGFAHPK